MQASTFTQWRKSSYSPQNSNCVEVGQVSGLWGVRDSKLGPASPVLAFDSNAFTVFLDDVKAGQFDL